MYDSLSRRYVLRCPAAGRDVAVALSRFRRIARIDGPTTPAVFRVSFLCSGCASEHDTLLTHDALDYAPVDPTAPTPFWDPLTGRVGGQLGDELAQAAADQLRRGIWPWAFWCSAEDRMRPGYPSALGYLAGQHDLVGVAVRCADCGETSLNMVSRRHLDEPFFHDPVVAALERPIGEIEAIERFRAGLWSSRFDAHRTDLAA